MDKIYSKGLPQVGAPQYPVGYSTALPLLAPLASMADGSVWLRTGVVVSKAPYPEASRLTYMRAHTFSEVTNAAVGAVTDIATNGSGTWVLCIGSTTAVYSSTDNGQTWTSRSHNATGSPNISKVVWTGTRFICAGSSGGNSSASSSTDGITWTAAFNSVLSTGTLAALVWTGTNVVFAWAYGSGTSTVATSATGLSGAWTTRTFSTLVGSTLEMTTGNGYVIANAGAAGSTEVSTDHGATWASINLAPLAAWGSNIKPMYCNGVFTISQGTGYCYSSTPNVVASWSTLQTWPGGLSVNGQLSFYAGSRLYAPTTSDGIVMCTDNGVDWYTQTLVLQKSNESTPWLTANARYAYANGVFMAGRSDQSRKVQVAASRPDASNALGTPAWLTSSTGAPFYTRIK